LGNKTGAEYYVEPEKADIMLDPVIKTLSLKDLDKAIEHTRKLMKSAAAKLEFIEAAQYRDELIKLEEMKK
jgi:excinuclease ABC subunit B